MRTAALGLVAIGGFCFVAFALTRMMTLLIVGLFIDAVGCFLLVQSARR